MKIQMILCAIFSIAIIDVNAMQAPFTKFGEYSQELDAAIMKQNKDEVQKLLQNPKVQQYINSPGGSRNYTPLQLATFLNNKNIAESLLAAGADINSSGSYKDTALHIAAKRGNNEMVNFLILKNAAVNTHNDQSETPLHLAAAGGHLNIVGILLEKKADMEAKDLLGRTPIFKAAENNQIALMEALIDKGVNLDVKETDTGDTMFHVAAKRGYHEVVELLLKSKKHPDVNARNSAGETAYGIAKAGASFQKGQAKIAKLLE